MITMEQIPTIQALLGRGINPIPKNHPLDFSDTFDGLFYSQYGHRRIGYADINHFCSKLRYTIEVEGQLAIKKLEAYQKVTDPTKEIEIIETLKEKARTRKSESKLQTGEVESKNKGSQSGIADKITGDTQIAHQEGDFQTDFAQSSTSYTDNQQDSTRNIDTNLVHDGSYTKTWDENETEGTDTLFTHTGEYHKEGTDKWEEEGESNQLTLKNDNTTETLKFSDTPQANFETSGDSSEYATTVNDNLRILIGEENISKTEEKTHDGTTTDDGTDSATDNTGTVRNRDTGHDEQGTDEYQDVTTQVDVFTQHITDGNVSTLENTTANVHQDDYSSREDFTSHETDSNTTSNFGNSKSSDFADSNSNEVTGGTQNKRKEGRQHSQQDLISKWLEMYLVVEQVVIDACERHFLKIY